MHTTPTEQLYRLVSDALEASGVGARQFEEMHGLKKWALRGLLDPERMQAPSIDKAKEICDALGLDLHLGPSADSMSSTALTEFATVPRFDARLAAGAGAVNDGAQELGAVAFRRDWLARHRIAPSQAMVMTVQGESMLPTLADGDLVLIDRRRTLPAGRRIYALTSPDGEERIKRIERLPDALLLHSDNKDFPTEIVPESDATRIRILGEAIWWGHLSRDRS